MSHELISSDAAVIVRAEIDMQISTAKAYPRDVSKFVDRATELATMDDETAESCFYCLTRKNQKGEVTEIKGPSIRLAEIAASCWGNLHAASRIIENDGKYITAEGVAWDLENNVRMSSQVKRSVTTKEGKQYGAEMQAVTGNAACAIALRNAILKVVPKARVDRVYEKAVKFAVGDQKTLNAKRKALFDRFKLMGIEQDQIFKFFNKEKLEDFNLTDLEKLIGIGTAIKDKMLEIDRAFVVDESNASLSGQERVSHLLSLKGASTTSENTRENQG